MRREEFPLFPPLRPPYHLFRLVSISSCFYLFCLFVWFLDVTSTSIHLYHPCTSSPISLVCFLRPFGLRHSACTTRATIYAWHAWATHVTSTIGHLEQIHGLLIGFLSKSPFSPLEFSDSDLRFNNIRSCWASTTPP